MALTPSNDDSAASIAGRTWLHSKPRLPQPKGGSAMDLIFFSAITRFKSCKPSCTHWNLDGCRQCFLVGKLIIQRGPESARFSVTNIFPTRTSFFLHAAS